MKGYYAFMTEKDVVRFLEQKDNYLILTHARPDGDTLGSAGGLCRGLRSLGKRAYVLFNPGVLKYYEVCTEGLYPDDGFVPETVVAVDIADPQLFFSDAKEYAGRVDLCIDHHPSNVAYADNLYLLPENAAAGEIIYNLLKKLGVHITKDIALALYIAIATDTGCFSFANTTAESHRIAAALMETGIDVSFYNDVLFNTKSRSKVELERILIENMEFLHGDRVAICTLSLEQIAAARATGADIEGIPSVPKHIEGVDVGITVRQVEDGCKISVRSSSKVDASLVCAQLGGGGHARAAGCFFAGNIEGGKKAILDALVKVYPDV